MHIKKFLAGDIKANQKTKLFLLLAILVVGFIPVRGLLVLLINDKQFTPVIYSGTLLITVFISFIAIKQSFSPKKFNLPNKIFYILLINLIFYFIWLLPVLFFNPVLDWLMAPIYLGFMPFLIFLFRLIDIQFFIKILAFVTIIIAVSVIWDFVEMNILLDRYEISFARQELLRPDNFEAIGRNDDLVRPNGLIGSRPHDASNLLAMFFVFWVLKYLFVNSSNKFFVTLLLLLSGTAMLASQVASNIIAAFFVLSIILPYGFIKHSKNIPFIGVGIVTITLFYSLTANSLIFDALMSGFNRAGPEGDWEGMTIFQVKKISDLLVTFLFGHAGSLHLFQAGEATEFAIIKIIFEQGIIHFIILLILFFYPYILFLKSKEKFAPIVLPFLGAFSVGLVSLWHYGSVFRITNGVIFWGLYAQIIVLFQIKNSINNNE
uniref:hypothetical protein n=1 Tax=Algoriphagus sp. TaxID=1872435 RepID=UPI0040477746